MAYNTKYRITFSDLHSVNPASWQIDLQTADYDGDIISLQPAASPLTINFGADSDNTDDKMATLIGTEADITIVIKDSSIDVTEFWVTEETAIKVLIYRNAVVYFSGFVKPDFCSYPYQQPPFEFTISASDGIGFLKGILVDLYEEARGDNQIGIIDLLTTRGLYKAQNDEVQQLMVLSSLHRIGLNPLHNEYIRVELLWDDPDTHVFLDIYSILDYIATSYGFRILTAEGKYWIQRIPDMPKNVTPDLLFFNTPDLTPVLVDDYELIKELGSIGDINNVDLIFAQNDSYITIQPAYKTIKNDLDYTFTGSLLNYDWWNFDSGDNSFDNWTKFDINCEVRQIINSWDNTKFSCYIEGYDSGTTYIYQQRAILWGYASINVKTTVKFYGYDLAKLNFRVLFPDGTVFYVYQQGTGSWALPGGTADGDYSITKDAESFDTEINLDLPFWDAPNFGAALGTPQPYTLEVRIIDPGNANSDTIRPPGITSPGVEFGPLIITFTYNDRIGDSISIDNSKNYSSVKSLDNFKLLDSDPGVFNLANAINYPGETEKLNWQSADQNYGSDKFHITQFRSFMDLCSYPYENMTGTYYSNSISPNHVIKRNADNKLFIVMSDEYDVRNCLHKMKLFEIKDVTTTTPTLVVKEDTKKVKPSIAMTIDGKYILVYIQNADGDYIATACDKSSTLHIETDFLEVTDPNGSKSRRRLPTLTDWTISGDGLVDYNRQISALYMQQSLLAGTQIQVRFFVQNGDGYAVYSGYGYFQSVDETGAAGGSAASYSYSIVADGAMAITSTIPQESEEGQLLGVLIDSDDSLVIDEDDSLIITK